MKFHIKRRTGEPKDPLNDLIGLLEDAMPPDGRLVVTIWVSPGEVSEENRERLHRHLLDEHGALGALSVGMKKGETPLLG